MNRRRESTPDTSQIHVNPNRPKTPSLLPTVKPTRDITPIASVQDETTYQTITNGRESETMVFNSRENTPVVRGYGTTADTVSDTAHLLNGKGVSTASLSDSESDDDQLEDKLFFSKENFKKNRMNWLRQLKIFLLLIGTLISSAYIVFNAEHEDTWSEFTLGQFNTETIALQSTDIPTGINSHKMILNLKGPFEEIKNYSKVYDDGKVQVQIGEIYNLTLGVVKDMLKTHTVQQIQRDVDFTNYNRVSDANLSFNWTGLAGPNASISAADDFCMPLDLSFKFTTDSVREEACAAIVLILVYGLIIFDLVHRTLAAILGSLAAIAVLAAFQMRPTLDTIVSWLDVETLSLLFGMMIIVAIFSETGFFDYCALLAYKIAKGKVWPLITLLCVFSGVVSAFLDNVTTILLLTPVTIRLCEVLNLDPKKILIAEVLFSNIGGTATAIGDPPNVIIVSHKDIKANNIHFSNFTGHMCIGIVFASIVGYGLLRLVYRKMEDLENVDPVEITELRHEIEMWRRAALRIVAVSREENIMKAIFHQRVAELENKLIKVTYKMKRRKQKNFKEMVKELEKKYKITNYPLLIKSGLVLAAVILLFFMHSFIDSMHVGLGWIALLGAFWLMVLSDMRDMETILHRVEWSTLIFFAGLFTLMEALAELGLIKWIGDQVKSVIVPIEDEKTQLLVAILLIIWVSAIASSFIDNIPFTTAMVPVLIILADDTPVPLMPMVLALAFGACLGGNGTLIGASANVVAAGIAEQHGYGFTFMDFFKIGFPMMIVTNIVATVYLIICHVWLGWNT